MKWKLPTQDSYGEILKRCELPGLSLTETVYSPGLKLPKHSHECAYFSFVLRGIYTQMVSGRSFTCKPYTLLFLPPKEDHTDQFHHTGARCVSIELEAKWQERIREQFRTLSDPAEFHEGLLAQLAIKIYNEWQQLDDLSPLAIEGLTLEIIARASRLQIKSFKQNIPRWLERAKEILHAEFNHSLSLKELAELVNVHPVHLSREFHKYFRCTISDYVRRLRIDFACRELADQEAELAQIALAAGFADQSHFSRTFKRHLGLTPTEFQKNFHER